MSSSPLRRAPDPHGSMPTSAEARLTELVRILAANPGTPMLAGLTDLESEQPGLLAVDLDPADPVRDLFGREIPDDWAGLAFAAGGHGHPVETDGPGAREPNGPGEAVDLAVAMTRDGKAAVAISPVDGTPRLDTPPAAILEGHAPDALRRLLRLDNPPPAASVADFVASQWLDRIAARAVAEPEACTWAEVAALHPAAEVAITRLPAEVEDTGVTATDVAHWATDHLPRVVAIFNRSCSWARLRQQNAESTDDWLGITPKAAAWMDDGMFSRWLLGHYPPVADLLDLVQALVPEGVVAGIVEVLDER